MRLVRVRAHQPAHARPEPGGPQTKRRRSRAPLIIFGAYAVVIGVNEWRLQGHVASADTAESVPAIEDIVIPQP